MICAEPIRSVGFKSDEGIFLNNRQDLYLQYADRLALHFTDGFALVFETEHYILELTQDGIQKTEKEQYELSDTEVIESYDYRMDEGIVVSLESLIFVGERIHSVDHYDGYYCVTFDDVLLDVIHYDEFPSSICERANEHGALIGCDRHIARRCDCGGKGEALFDGDENLVIRCAKCHLATRACDVPSDAFAQWNRGETPVTLQIE